jgi:parallel beta-helix repeat protein
VRTEDGWRVEDCTVEDVDGNGLGAFGTHVVIRDVIAQDNGVSGISGSHMHESLLLDSVTRRNNTNVQTSEGGGGKITRANGLLVDNLDVYQNNGPGFWFDIDNINCVVQNSRFHGNVTLKKPDGSDRITGRGLFLEISGVDSDGKGKAIDAGPLLVENNLVYDNGSAGITVYATANAHLRRNTIVNDVVELKDKRPAPYSVHDLTIVGNFFKNAKIVADGSSASNYGSRRYVIDGNTYDTNGGGTIFSWDAKRYSSPSSIFNAFGFEKTGRLGAVNVTLPA